MRYAVIHCRNSDCRQHVWVPEDKLGIRGRCPDCGQPMDTPAFVPADELVEGPHIIAELEPCDRLVAAH